MYVLVEKTASRIEDLGFEVDVNMEGTITVNDVYDMEVRDFKLFYRSGRVEIAMDLMEGLDFHVSERTFLDFIRTVRAL